MKRKTIVIAGISGALLAGVSATALLGYQYFKPRTDHFQAQVAAGPTNAGGILDQSPQSRIEPQLQPPQQIQPQPQPQQQVRRDARQKGDRVASGSQPMMEHEGYSADTRYRHVAPADQFSHPARPSAGSEKYGEFEDNPVTPTADDQVSTFSIDVDTAAYAVVRRYLEDGTLPPRDAVRTEELVNYFNYDYAMPESRDEPFAADVAVYDTPWDEGTQLIRIGLQGYDIPAETRPAANLVFLVDTSGSMNSQDKLPLLKKSLRLLVDQMDEDDTIAIVAYAGSAGVVLEPTRGSERRRILSALNGFRATGSTAGAAGIAQAYALAEANYREDAVNRVILATDGDFNVGPTDNSTLEQYVARKRKTGIYLSILGFGTGNYKDDRMQVLAQAGNGNAAYIDSLIEARKVLVDEMGSTLFTIANDVKIQVEFNPAYVADYRLIGYETRLLARQDFNNDKVDAGEVGSGHEVTAIYEITPPDSDSRLVDPLRYGEPTPKPAAGVKNGEIAFLRLRYKLPGETRSVLWEQPILAEARTSFAEAPAEARFATAVAGFGQLLRGSIDMGDFTYEEVFRIARGARGEDPFGNRSEFIRLVQLAQSAQTPEFLNN